LSAKRCLDMNKKKLHEISMNDISIQLTDIKEILAKQDRTTC